MSDKEDEAPGKPRAWDPTGRDKPGLDPSKFATMAPAEKVETLIGMIGVFKAFGGDPKQMLREAIGSLTPEQKKQLAADPKTQAQLRALLDAL